MMRWRSAQVVAAVLTCVGTAHAAHICRVERVVQSGEELRVFMVAGHERAPSLIARADGTQSTPTYMPGGSLPVREGDAVHFSGMPHDHCVGKVTRRSDRLRLMLEASLCMPGKPCMSSTETVE